MNSLQAANLDKGSKHVDFDEENEVWGIFGTQSGFCYASYTSKEEAEEALKPKKGDPELTEEVLKARAHELVSERNACNGYRGFHSDMCQDVADLLIAISAESYQHGLKGR